MKISFIIPCRNNLKYLQLAVNSIFKYYGEKHDIVILDDASTDGTEAWCNSMCNSHTNILFYKNKSNERIGHTILYDIGISIAKTDIVTILHSDMVISENYVENLLKHLKEKTIVSATRIEPPLHPPGPEKIIKNFGIEPEDFDEIAFETFTKENSKLLQNKVTHGIFAPWILYKSDFVRVGGHDKLFAPMELEDSDIFNRFYLAGYNFVQSRDSFVYHMTCRGSRFKDGIEIEAKIPLQDGTVWYKPKDSDEYVKLKANKIREWHRKWHAPVLHDELMMPIVPDVYDQTFIIRNCNEYILNLLEPFCDKIIVDCDFKNYLKTEQSNTYYNLSSKIINYNNVNINGIINESSMCVEFNSNEFAKDIKNYIQFIVRLSEIIKENIKEPGIYEWDIFKIYANSVIPKPAANLIHPVIKNIF